MRAIFEVSGMDMRGGKGQRYFHEMKQLKVKLLPSGGSTKYYYRLDTSSYSIPLPRRTFRNERGEGAEGRYLEAPRFNRTTVVKGSSP